MESGVDMYRVQDYDIINYVPSLSTFIQIELPIQNGVEIKKTIKKTVATG